jgi:hypothetical protein
MKCLMQTSSFFMNINLEKNSKEYIHYDSFSQCIKISHPEVRNELVIQAYNKRNDNFT